MPSKSATTRGHWIRYIAAVFMIAAALSAIAAVLILHQHGQPKSVTRQALVDKARAEVQSFMFSVDHSTARPFTVTYRVSGDGWPFNYTGLDTISYAPTGSAGLVPPKLVAVNGMGRYGYVFREDNRDVIQWILDGTNVSWCLKIVSRPQAKLTHLECTGPHAYIYSNGFFTQSQPFIPTTAFANVTYTWPKGTVLPRFTRAHSTVLGALHCMTEFEAGSKFTTCLDTTGFLASTYWSNGANWSRATLVSWSGHADESVLKTLTKSTQTWLSLPPV
jgi:hypothetical protein